MSQLVPVDVELLRDLLDDSECSFDHSDACQAHGYFGLEPGEKCPQRKLRDLLEGGRATVTYCPNCTALGTIELGEPFDDSGRRNFACTACGSVYGWMSDKGSLDIGILGEEDGS